MRGSFENPVETECRECNDTGNCPGCNGTGEA